MLGKPSRHRAPCLVDKKKEALAAEIKMLENKLQFAKDGKANSSNCPQDWRRFVQLAKAKKLPSGMSAQYKTSRLDLFNVFIMNNQDCFGNHTHTHTHIYISVCLSALPA